MTNVKTRRLYVRILKIMGTMKFATLFADAGYTHFQFVPRDSGITLKLYRTWNFNDTPTSSTFPQKSDRADLLNLLPAADWDRSEYWPGMTDANFDLLMVTV